MNRQLLLELVRQQLEHDLVNQVRDAERAYQSAWTESSQLDEYSPGLPRTHADGAGAIPETAATKRACRDRFKHLLDVFTEFELNARPSRGLLLGTLLDTAMDIVGADKGAIQVLDLRGRLKVEVQRGFDRPFLDYFAQGYDGATACSVALQTAKRIIVEDITESPMFTGTPCLPIMLEAGLRAVQSTPLMSRQGQTLGILSTHYCRAIQLSREDLLVLDRIGSQAATCIEVCPGQ